MSDKILFVDDELMVLDGYKRTLRRDFEVDVANSGQEGLEAIAQNKAYAVVVSDMRMPGMDGVQFLSRVSEVSPSTVRVILTGHADLDTVIGAVNEGRIFRFLTKPCESDLLKKTLTTCLVQYRLITAEKELLESTLMGSIKVLTDVLSLANPAAFSRAVRIRRYVKHMVSGQGLEASWKYEMAALLSQLGCITLPPEIIEAAYHGTTLPPDDQAAFNKHPAVAAELLSNIPRLDGVAWIVGHQRLGDDSPSQQVTDGIRMGAEILRVAIEFDRLKVKGLKDADAIDRLKHETRLNQTIIDKLASIQPESGKMELREVKIPDLATGMILQEEIRTHIGVLLVGRGQEVNYPLLIRLNSFYERRGIPERVLVLVPCKPASNVLVASASQSK
jgi:response regulator RpfG family c-di-GMP phosphodiesterase